MSLKETLSLAHTAQCKLHIAANRPDRNLRFVLGHALTLDTLSLRLMQIEEEQAIVEQPKHATGIKFKAAGNGTSGRRRSPPPSRLSHAVDPDEEEDGEDDYGVDDDDESDDEQDELALTRFPSGSARAPQPPPLVPSDDDSDEEDEPPSPPPLTDEELRRIVNSKGSDGDVLLTSLYKGIKGCRCHGQTDTAPNVEQLWEVPAQDNKGPRFAVAQIAPPVAA